MTFTLQLVPANLSKVGIQRGENPTRIPEIDHQCKFDIYMANLSQNQLKFAGWTTLVDWQGEKNDAAVMAAPITTTEKRQELGEERDLHLPFLYMGDPSKDQDPIAGYGATNVAKLKAASKKYDPARIFQTLQNNRFLLSKV